MRLNDAIRLSNVIRLNGDIIRLNDAIRLSNIIRLNSNIIRLNNAISLSNIIGLRAGQQREDLRLLNYSNT